MVVRACRIFNCMSTRLMKFEKVSERLELFETLIQINAAKYQFQYS